MNADAIDATVEGLKILTITWGPWIGVALGAGGILWLLSKLGTTFIKAKFGKND